MLAAFSTAAAADAATIQWEQDPAGSDIWKGTYTQSSATDNIAIGSGSALGTPPDGPGSNALEYTITAKGSAGDLAAVKSWGNTGGAIVIGKKGVTQSIVIDVNATGSSAQGQGVMSYNQKSSTEQTNQQSDVTLNASGLVKINVSGTSTYGVSAVDYGSGEGTGTALANLTINAGSLEVISNANGSDNTGNAIGITAQVWGSASANTIVEASNSVDITATSAQGSASGISSQMSEGAKSGSANTTVTSHGSLSVTASNTSGTDSYVSGINATNFSVGQATTWVEAADIPNIQVSSVQGPAFGILSQMSEGATGGSANTTVISQGSLNITPESQSQEFYGISAQNNSTGQANTKASAANNIVIQAGATNGYSLGINAVINSGTGSATTKVSSTEGSLTINLTNESATDAYDNDGIAAWNMSAGQAYTYVSAAKSILIQASSSQLAQANGILAYAGTATGGSATTEVTTEGSLKINVSNDSETPGQVSGIAAWNYQSTGKNSTKATVTANTINIQASAPSGNMVYGVLSQAASSNTNATATVNISAVSTSITARGASAVGIAAYNGGQVSITGGLNVSASTTVSGGTADAIQTNNNSQVTINGNAPEGMSSAPVIIRGNISYSAIPLPNTETTPIVPGTSTVTLNLSGPQSYWSGNALYRQTVAQPAAASNDEPQAASIAVYASNTPSPTAAANVGSMNLNLTLSDGATWKPAYVAPYMTAQNANTSSLLQLPVNSITSNDGVIDASSYGYGSSKRELQVGSYSGLGGTYITNLINDAGDYSPQTVLNITTVTDPENTSIAVETESVHTGDLPNAAAALDAAQALADSVLIAGGPAAAYILQTVEITDPNGGPSIFVVVPQSGEISLPDLVIENSPLFDKLETAVALGTAQWRAQIGSLFTRLGDIRDEDGKTGAWVRVYQNRVKWRGEHNDTVTVQLGADYKVTEEFVLGGAFNYSKGDTKVSGVDGDNHAWGFAVYGGWFAPNGLYAGFEGKFNRLDNKISSSDAMGSMHGKYKANAWSLSAEAGWTIPLNETFFVEPQAQLSWGQAGSDNFSTGFYTVKQKSFNVVEGRIGARAGAKFPDNKGQAYLKASVLYDWASKFKGSLQTAGIDSKFDEKLGGCAGEFSIGGQYNFTKNAHFYAEVTTRAGGKLKEPFQWNAGLRFSF